ncbi:hypothetical protein M8J75_009617 [Diaphorina citri]|nr:hypothetical protein M8J75_009617 [Diaphorina citri]
MSLTPEEIESFLDQSFVDSDVYPDSDEELDPAEVLIQRAQSVLESLDEDGIPINHDFAEEIILQNEHQSDAIDDLIREEELEVAEEVEEAQVEVPTTTRRFSPRSIRRPVHNKAKRKTKKQKKIDVEVDWCKPPSFIFNKPQWIPAIQQGNALVEAMNALAEKFPEVQGEVKALLFSEGSVYKSTPYCATSDVSWIPPPDECQRDRPSSLKTRKSTR